MIRIIGVLYLIFAFSFILEGQSIALSTDKDSINLGDKINLRIDVQHPQGTTIESIDFSVLEDISNYLYEVDSVFQVPKIEVEIHNGEAYGIQDGKLFISNPNKQLPSIGTIQLLVLDFGMMDIPSPIVKLSNGETLTSNILPRIYIHPNTAQSDQDGQGGMINDIKDIVEEEVKWTDYLVYFYIILGILSIGYLVFWGSNKLNQSKDNDDVSNEPVEITPAHIVALKELNALKKKELWQNGQEKKYHSELTHIMRQYLENRYQLGALEMTTADISKELYHLKVDKSEINKFIDILQIADIVKFAKGEAGAGMNEKFLGFAFDFVRSTQLIESLES